jgi:iron complex transport system ATP-binding protein
MKNLIDIKNANVYRGGTKILRDFSLQIKQGEHTVILGANGCGKSTFLGLLSRRFCHKVAD